MSGSPLVQVMVNRSRAEGSLGTALNALNVERQARSLSMSMTAADPADEFIHMCVCILNSRIYIMQY